MLRATTACTFSTSQLPKVAQTCGVLNIILTSKCSSRQNGVHFFDISASKSGANMWCFFFNMLNSKCASRHNGVQFFISHLASWLRTRRFNPPEPQIIGKTHCFATFLPFRASASSLFDSFSSTLLFYSSLLLFSSTLLFSLTLPISAFICPYCRKFDF